MEYFVYILFHPITDEVFYVGITNNAYKRFKQHVACKGHNVEKNEHIKAIKEAKLMPGMRILDVVDGLDVARSCEKRWIQHYLNQGATLKNILTPSESVEVKAVEPKRKIVRRRKAEPGLLDAYDVLELLNISRNTLYALIKRGVISPIDKLPFLERRARLQFRESDVEQLLNGETAPSDEEAHPVIAA